VYGDKVNFLFTQWTNLPDSVNLSGACDSGHVIRLSAVSKCSFDTAVQQNVQFVNNVIMFVVSRRLNPKYSGLVPPSVQQL
jgi:hypothetical protein